jgi:hypothetical protein
MVKNTYKKVTSRDIKESNAKLKLQVIEKYEERQDKATAELNKVKREREKSRNVMHDVGLKNQMDILQAEIDTLQFCMKTLINQK